MARILAIEPDPDRSVILQRLVKESLDVDIFLANRPTTRSNLS